MSERTEAGTTSPSMSAAEMRLLADIAEKYQEELSGATDENDQCAYVEQVIVRFDSGVRAALQWDDGCVCFVAFVCADSSPEADR